MKTKIKALAKKFITWVGPIEIELDLTKVGLIALIVVISLFGFRQCSEKKDVEAALTDTQQELGSLRVEYGTQNEVMEEYKDSSEYYKAKADSKAKEIDIRKDQIAVLLDSIKGITSDQALTYIDENFEKEGEDVTITEGQAVDFVSVDVERIELNALVGELQEVLILREKSLDACSSAYSECEEGLITCQEEAVEKDLEIKSQKRKKNNRTVFGGIMSVLVVVALL